jgi:hypothetical protein
MCTCFPTQVLQLGFSENCVSAAGNYCSSFQDNDPLKTRLSTLHSTRASLIAVGVHPLVSMAQQFLQEEGQPVTTTMQPVEQQNTAQGQHSARDDAIPSREPEQQQATAQAEVCVCV